MSEIEPKAAAAVPLCSRSNSRERHGAALQLRPQVLLKELMDDPLMSVLVQDDEGRHDTLRDTKRKRAGETN